MTEHANQLDSSHGVSKVGDATDIPDSGWPGMDALIEIVHKAESEYAKNRPHGTDYTRPHNDQIRRVITAIWPIAYRAAYTDYSQARANEETRGESS